MLISTPVYARDTDTGYEAGQTFDWAPSSSSISIEEYTTLFDFCYNIEWDTTGANLVNNLLDPPNFWDYFAMECRDVDTGSYFDLGGTTGGYTNLPVGTWQAEDDNGDDLDEEVEYYWANEGLVADYNYAFEPEFVKAHSSGSTYLHLIAQQGPLHQGYDWDFLRETSVSWTDSGWTKASSNEKPNTRSRKDKTILQNLDNDSSIAYKVQVGNEFARATVLFNQEVIDINALKEQQKTYLKQIDEASVSPVTITFNPNTTLEQAEQLLKGNIGSGGTFKYQAVQPDGVIGSGYFENSSQGYTSFKKACSRHNLTDINVTGYIGEAKSKEVLEALMESSIVALVDISKPFIEKDLEKDYPGKEVKAYVPELYVALFSNH